MPHQETAVLLLPGLLCDAFVWQGQQAALQALAPTYVADFRFCDTITAMAQSALALCQGGVLIIGHSMGARVALEAARMAGPRVVGLGLLDTGIHPQRQGEAIKRQALVDLAMTQGMAALADAWLPPMVAPHRRGDSALMAPLQAMVERMTPDIFSRQIHALLNRPDAATHLGGIGCPTLVMVGRQDEWSPPAQHEEIAALIPHANLHIIEDAGHMLPCEQPATVAQELRRFVQAILNTAG